MGHNVSKRHGKITEINSVSIRQSLANGDVEVVENGTLSGKPENGNAISGMYKSIRRSLRPSIRPMVKKRENGATNGTLSSTGEMPLADHKQEEPDITSATVERLGRASGNQNGGSCSGPGSVLGQNEEFQFEGEETRSSKRKKKKKTNRPYRRDSVLAINLEETKENGAIKTRTKAQMEELFPKTSNEKGYESVSLDDEIFCTGSQSESCANEDEQCGRRFQRQRSTTRRKSRQARAERGETTGVSRRNSINRQSRRGSSFNEGNANKHTTNGNGNRVKTTDNGEEVESAFVSPTELYNIINMINLGCSEEGSDVDREHIVLFDTRDIEDYEFAHIIGAKRACLGESILGVDSNISYKWTILYDDEGHDHFLSQSVLTSVLDRLTYLGHRSRILKGGFQSFVEKYPFMCQTEEHYIRHIVSHYPFEILEDKLYLGCTEQAKNKIILSDLGIVYVLNIGENMIKPVRDTGRVMNLQFKENSKTDLLKVMPQVLSVFTSAVDEKGAKILVTCDTGNNKSAAVVALYLMYRQKLTMAEAVRLIKTSRNSIELSPGISYQLQRCEKLVSQAY